MKFQYVPTMEIFITLTRGRLSPTKILMPSEMFTDFLHDPRVHGIARFHGAEVECSTSLAENQIEFQNAIEPTAIHLNGRFEIGTNIGQKDNGLPRDWKRIDE